jgi:hypothetical protein
VPGNLEPRSDKRKRSPADSDTAGPALHLLADEGRTMLSYLAFTGRLLLVTGA